MLTAVEQTYKANDRTDDRNQINDGHCDSLPALVALELFRKSRLLTACQGKGRSEGCCWRFAAAAAKARSHQLLAGQVGTWAGEAHSVNWGYR